MTTAVVRERPLLMSGPMVRGTLDGTKTQTRRVVRLPKYATPDNAWPATYEQRLQDIRETFPSGPAGAWSKVVGEEYEGQRLLCNRTDGVGIHVAHCPHGEPGDRLWVRETWAAEFLWPEYGGGRMRQWAQMPPANRVPGEDAFVAYRADGAIHGCENNGVDDRACSDGAEQNARWAWRPSIFMPRWASRITLELTDVRVERVQDISEADAIAEGLTRLSKDGGRVYKYGIPDRDGLPGSDDDGWDWFNWYASPVHAYARLWDQINAKRGYGWDVNPWVWVLDFQPIAAPIRNETATAPDTRRATENSGRPTDSHSTTYVS